MFLLWKTCTVTAHSQNVKVTFDLAAFSELLSISGTPILTEPGIFIPPGDF